MQGKGVPATPIQEILHPMSGEEIVCQHFVSMVKLYTLCNRNLSEKVIDMS